MSGSAKGVLNAGAPKVFFMYFYVDFSTGETSVPMQAMAKWEKSSPNWAYKVLPCAAIFSIYCRDAVIQAITKLLSASTDTPARRFLRAFAPGYESGRCPSLLDDVLSGHHR